MSMNVGMHTTPLHTLTTIGHFEADGIKNDVLNSTGNINVKKSKHNNFSSAINSKKLIVSTHEVIGKKRKIKEMSMSYVAEPSGKRVRRVLPNGPHIQ